MTETDEERETRTGLSSNDISNDAAKAVQKTPYRIDIGYIRSRITDEEFYHPLIAPHMTICIMRLDNGYFLVGKSTPADPENFDPELGKKFAREDAERSAWPLFAFALRDQLTDHNIRADLEAVAIRAAAKPIDG